MDNASKRKCETNDAFWISPRGQMLRLAQGSKHILEVIKCPEAFGFTIEEIEGLYKKHNEPIGIEGKARKEIILSLISKDWIRIRRYMRQDMFTVNINRMTTKVKNYLYKWAKAMEENGLKFSAVKIDTPTGVINSSIGDIANDALFAESEGDDLIVVDSVYDL